MKKMFKLLENVNNYNNFCEVDSFEHVNGNQQDIYFRLIQKKSGNCEECDKLRWIPSLSATVSITFEHLDSSKQIIRAATMVYPSDDRSIFKVTVLANELITGAVKVTLTDGGLTETLLLDGRMTASNTDSDRFFC